MGVIDAPHEMEEGWVGQNVATPQCQTLYGRRSECAEGFGYGGRMKRRGSRCVYLLGEAVVVVVVVVAPVGVVLTPDDQRQK